MGKQVPDELPETHYHEYFAPDYSLNVAAHKVMDDCNKKDVSGRTGLVMHVALAGRHTPNPTPHLRPLSGACGDKES